MLTKTKSLQFKKSLENGGELALHILRVFKV